jgi:hypothetical protein
LTIISMYMGMFDHCGVPYSLRKKLWPLGADTLSSTQGRTECLHTKGPETS